jgi:hypothetical protein
MIYWMRPRRAPWRKAMKVATLCASGAALMLDVRPAVTQTLLDVYRERVAMNAAGARCHLFDADTTFALDAWSSQSRTAALRAGYTLLALDSANDGAREAVSNLACNSARVQEAANRTRDAFRAYSGLRRMTFPGQVAAWRADRSMPQQTASWRLAQDAYAGEDKVVFGVAGQQGVESMALAVAPSDGSSPYTARLIVRDPTRLAEPQVRPGVFTLQARAPLRAAAKVIMADAKAPADPALRPQGAGKAVAFRFPPSAKLALEQLDPREAVSVEILYPSDRGELVHTAFLEVGDFDAGVAFLKTAAR